MGDNKAIKKFVTVARLHRHGDALGFVLSVPDVGGFNYGDIVQITVEVLDQGGILAKTWREGIGKCE